MIIYHTKVTKKYVQCHSRELVGIEIRFRPPKFYNLTSTYTLSTHIVFYIYRSKAWR